jgi:hypothetical protein
MEIGLFKTANKIVENKLSGQVLNIRSGRLAQGVLASPQVQIAGADLLRAVSDLCKQRGRYSRAKIRLSAIDARPKRHHSLGLTNRGWCLGPVVNTEELRPHWQTRASTLCRILLRLHFPLPAEPIDHQPDQERRLPQSNNNLAADGFESAPQLRNRGLLLCNFAGTS